MQDGDTLYVDRNGNGNLTEPAERVSAAKDAGLKEDGYTFEAGDLAVGRRVHKGLSVSLYPLKRYAGNPALADVAVIRNALKADPAAVVATLSVHQTRPGSRGSARRADRATSRVLRSGRGAGVRRHTGRRPGGPLRRPAAGELLGRSAGVGSAGTLTLFWRSAPPGGAAVRSPVSPTRTQFRTASTRKSRSIGRVIRR